MLVNDTSGRGTIELAIANFRGADKLLSKDAAACTIAQILPMYTSTWEDQTVRMHEELEDTFSVFEVLRFLGQVQSNEAAGSDLTHNERLAYTARQV